MISYFYLTCESPEAQIRNMKYIFEKGKVDLQKHLPNILISRTEIEKILKEILRPSFPYAYNLIMGESGTGKTTLIKQTILSLENPKVNIQYIDIFLLSFYF